MYRLSVFVVVLLACISSAASAQKLRVPASPAPEHVVAQVKGDNLQITRTVRKYVPTIRTRVVLQNGEKKEVKETAYMPVSMTVVQQRPLKSLGLYNGRGEKIDAEDVKDGLKKPAVVLMSADGKKVAPFYLKVVKAETFVIVDKTRVRRVPARPPAIPRRKQK